MTPIAEPLFPVPDQPSLSPRQQAAYDYIRAHDGVPADEIGAHWHEQRGKHAAGSRCEWCDADGRDVVRSKALRPLVTYRRTRDGNLYVLRDRSTPHSSSAGPQLDELPGESFEDIFGGAA